MSNNPLIQGIFDHYSNQSFSLSVSRDIIVHKERKCLRSNDQSRYHHRITHSESHFQKHISIPFYPTIILSCIIYESVASISLYGHKNTKTSPLFTLKSVPPSKLEVLPLRVEQTSFPFPSENLHQMENDEKYMHGRLDPGIESTLELIKGVESLDTSTFSSSLEAPSSESSYGKIALSPGMSLLCCIVSAWCAWLAL